MRTADVPEDWAARHLISLVPKIDGWMTRFEAGPPRAMPLSAMLADDRATDPYQISHSAWMSLSNAIDNLHAFRTMAISGSGDEFEVTTRPYGGYASLRATIENAATGIFILEPDDRNERIVRRLRLWVQDGRYVERINDSLGNNAPEVLPRRIAKISPIIAAQGLAPAEVEQSVNYGYIVSSAAPALGKTPNEGKAMWQILSGLTHGQMWAGISVTDHETLSVQLDDRSMNNRVTSSVSTYAACCTTACLWVEAGLALYDRRCSNP